MEDKLLNIEKYVDNISLKNKIARSTWMIIRSLLFKPFYIKLFNPWRIFLLKMFGAKIGKGSIVYSSAIIPAPWNLEMGSYSCIGPKVELHIGKIFIGSKVTISQGVYLCNGSHDIKYLNKPFITEPIFVNDFAWIAADAFIGMGVTIGQGAVVGARACVFKNVDSWTVVGGNPARFIKKREIIK